MCVDGLKGVFANCIRNDSKILKTRRMCLLRVC